MLKTAADESPSTEAIAAWGIGVYQYDHASDSLSGSARFCELYSIAGCRPVRAEVAWAAVHPGDQEVTRASLRRAAEPEGEPRVDLVHRVLATGGGLRWLHVRAVTRFDGRAPRVTYGSVVDITGRRLIEQELRQTDARFEEAVRASQFGIFEHDHIADPNAENLYWSPRQREIFGVSPDAPATLATFLERVHPDDLPEVRAAVSRAHDPAGDGSYDVEHRYLHPDGQTRWQLSRSSTHFGEVDGRRVPLRTVGVMLDVTARRHSELEHEQRAAVLDATPDFVSMTHVDGRLVYVNQAGREFLGIRPGEDLSGRTMASAHPPDSLSMIRGEGAPTAIRDGSWKGKTEFLRHDGAVVPMSQVLLSHRGRDGKVVLLSTIARDLSRERQLEERIRQVQKMEAVGQLAGGVAHDFNNILSAIMGFADLAVGEIGPHGRGYSELQDILSSAERAASLTRQLLAFSRKQVLRPRVVDVNESINKMEPMIRRLVGENIDVKILPAEEPLRVKADPSHLEQILLNLSVNARDAMEGGGRLTIESRRAELDAATAASQVDLSAGVHVVISVSDNGMGMDEKTQTRIFEPFFTTKGPGHGTGLGLATVFGIVKQGGGAISVYSEVGHGSTFKVYFPCTDEPATPVAGASDGPRHRREGVVLVAEDDAQLRKVIVTVLRRAGFSVLEAAGPIEALAIEEEYAGRIDLLLTDVVMPQMSGRQLAERLLARRPSLPVVYMSGYTDDRIGQHGVLDEGVNFLAKPVSPDGVVAMVERVLGEAR